MPDEDNLKKWVENKLDEGIDEERIRNSLENTGHDPSIVDEVKNPFGNAEVEEDPFEEDNSEENPEKKDQDQNSSETIQENSETPDIENVKEKLSSISEKIDASNKNFRLLGISIIILLGLGIVLGSVQSSGVLEPEKQCVGVKLYSLSVDSGATAAEVMTVEEARVVLEIFENGEKIGSNSKVLDGEGTISVKKVGDKASFHGIKCPEQASERSY